MILPPNVRPGTDAHGVAVWRTYQGAKQTGTFYTPELAIHAAHARGLPLVIAGVQNLAALAGTDSPLAQEAAAMLAMINGGD